MRLKLGHKIVLFWLVTLGLSMALVGLVFVSMVKDMKDNEIHENMANGFHFVHAELARNNKEILTSLELLSARKAMISSVNMIFSYQDISDYSPIIFDVEKENLVAQIKRHAKSANLGLVSVFDANKTLLAFYSLSADGSESTGFTTYSKGEMYIHENGTFLDGGLQKPGSLPQFVADFPSHQNTNQFTRTLSLSNQGLLIEGVAPIKKSVTSEGDFVVGYIKVGRFLGAEFAAKILADTGFKFGLVLPGKFAVGEFDASILNEQAYDFPEITEASSNFVSGKLDHQTHNIGGQSMMSSGGQKIALLLGKEKTELSAEVTAFQNASLLVLGLVAVLIIPAGIFFIGHFISSPVRRLVAGFESLRDGGYPHLKEVSGNDEMNQIVVSFNDTSDTLKRRERELRRLSTGIEKSPVLVIITDPSGRIEYVNPKFEEVTGYDLKSVSGEILHFLALDHSTGVEHADIWDTISAGKIWRGEFQSRKKNGDLFWESTSITPIRGKDGDIESFLSVGEDITERKLAERKITELIESLEQRVEERTRELKKSEDRLIKSQNFANIGTWDWNIQTGELFWSSKIAPLFGYPEGNLETTYDNFIAAVHPDERQKVIDAVNACVEEGADYNIEHRTVWPDGTVRYLLEKGDVVRDENGTPLNMLGVVQDITERKKAEDQLQESEERTRLLLQSAGEGIYGLDNHGVTTFVNPAACEILGYAEDELTGQPMHSLIHHSYPDGTPYPRENCPMYAAYIDGEVNSVVDEVLWRKDGTSVPVHYTSTPILIDGKLNGAVVTFNDITDTLSREMELKRSNMELQEFAYAASHDLQEPLRKIQSFSERLSASHQDSLSEKGQIYIDRIVTSATRMRQLIDDLLNYSRVTTKAQPFESVNLDELLGHVLDDLETSIDESKAKINVGALPAIEGDPTQMRQLMQNIISNSIKFRREGQSLSIDISSEQPKDGPTSMNAEALCEITIRDNGIGFDPKFTDRIFGVFERLHGRGEYPGTGIGLATCKKIVERHNGSINASSAPGSGAAFLIKLPIKQGRGKTI